MWDFSVGRALGLMAQTAPFIVLRIVVYAGIAIAWFLATGTGAGIGWGIGGFGDEGFQIGAAFWGGLIGFGLAAGMLYLVREYILYIVKAGHIAVLVELMDGKSIPEGRGQIDYATEIVKARFAEANVLFAVDQLVKGVLAAIVRTMQGLAMLIPVPGMQTFMSLVHGYLRIAIGFVDEVILAYAIRTRTDNPWESARVALVYYAQNAKPMMQNAAFLTAIVYGLSLVVFILMLAPAAALVWFMPGGWSALSVVFALIFAWAVKAALLEPFAIACMMQAYFTTIEGQTPDPEWDARLTQVSNKFNELKEKSGLWRPAPPVAMPIGGAIRPTSFVP